MEKNTYSVPCIYPLTTKPKTPISVTVPGSKSITNRALLLAVMANGISTLQGVLFSDDSRYFLKCIQDLGFQTQVQEEEKRITVTGLGGKIPLVQANQYVGSAGTAARFLTAYLGVSFGTYFMDASAQMRKRPMLPLLESLQQLGCEIEYYEEKGHFPFTLHGHGFQTDSIAINIDHSSQFLSALLIASCLSEHNFTIQLEGTHGMSYIQMTCEMMSQFGVHILHPSPNQFIIPENQHYLAQTYQIEPDISAACYFYAISPLLGISMQVQNVHFNCLQGDIKFLQILEQMGCTMQDEVNGIIVNPPADGIIHGVDVNMSSCSDQAITLAAIAPFADSPVTIRGIGHIRYQESNRIAAIITELGKMGILCQETEDGLIIYPNSPKPSAVDTYDDHRMAMGFSLIGLRTPGIIINNPECCRKTFEHYFEVLDTFIDNINTYESSC